MSDLKLLGDSVIMLSEDVSVESQVGWPMR